MQKPYTVTIEPGRLLDVEEFSILPQTEWRTELIEGRVYRMAPVKDPRHDYITLNIATAIEAYARPRKLGRCTLQQVGYDLTLAQKEKGTVLVPDVAFVRDERAHIVRAAINAQQYVPLAPDLVAEIVSPSQATQKEMQERAMLWLVGGTRIVWNVWPLFQRVDVWTPDSETAAVYHASGVLPGGDVLPGLSIEVDTVFL